MSFPPKEKHKYIDLLKVFYDVFSWSCEVKKIFDAKIIVPLIFPKWVSNLVPTRKNTREIRCCMDFRNLNKVYLKDNYPLPKMDHII